MNPISSAERLNAIGSQLKGVQRYLEIGVAKGTTFFEVEAAEKHAVDPRFRFDPAIRSLHSSERYHPMIAMPTSSSQSAKRSPSI